MFDYKRKIDASRRKKRGKDTKPRKKYNDGKPRKQRDTLLLSSVMVATRKPILKKIDNGWYWEKIGTGRDSRYYEVYDPRRRQELMPLPENLKEALANRDLDSVLWVLLQHQLDASLQGKQTGFGDDFHKTCLNELRRLQEIKTHAKWAGTSRNENDAATDALLDWLQGSIAEVNPDFVNQAEKMNGVNRGYQFD